MINKFLRVFILVLFCFSSNDILAASNQWIQSDWSGGPGESTENQFDEATGINSATVGEISLSTRPDWHASGWTHRKRVTLTNAGAEMTNFPVLITVTYDDNMNADFSDLRFTTTSGTTVSFWIESYVISTSAKVWVKIPLLTALGQTELEMYYGNESAESESSGADTFVFFDGFDAASIDTSKWTQANVLDDFNVVDGKLVLGAGTSSFNQALYTTSAFARSNLVMEFDYTWTSANTSYDAIMMGWKDDGTGRTQTNLVYAHYNAGASTCTVNCTGYVFEDGTSRSGVTSKYTQNQPYRLRLSMKTEGGATYQQSSDAGQTWSTIYNSVHSTESNLHPGFVLHSGTHVIDNVRVRPWTSTEPTVSIDAEVSQYSAVSGTLLSSVYDTGEAGCAVESIAHTVSDTGLVEIRLRSANAPNMSDATDFSACDAIDGSTSFTAYPCVQAHDRYLQYQLVLGTEEDLGPTLTDITINYDSLSLQANAGEDRIVAAGRAITLDGLASTGIDLSYAWAVFEGEGVLADEFTATPTLTIPAGAQRSQTSVTLTVYDAYGQHASDEVTLSILGTPTLSLAENKLANLSSGLTLYETLSADDRISLHQADQFTIVLPPGLTAYSYDVSDNGQLIVGLPEYESETGAVFVFADPVSELSGSFDLAVSSETLFTTHTGQHEGDRFGAYVLALDLMGDGEDETLISAPGYGDDGALYCFDATAQLIGIMIGEPDARVGSLLKADLVDDELPDVLIGPDLPSLNGSLEPFDSDDPATVPELMIYSGLTDFSGVSTPTLLEPDIIISDADNHDNTALGDINADGLTDVVTINGTKNLFIHFGKLSGDLTAADADVRITGADLETGFGASLAIGDVNGDSVNDLIVGDPLAGESSAGTITIVFGSTDWSESIDVNTAPNVMMVSGTGEGAQVGGDLVVADTDGNDTDEIYTLTSQHNVFFIDLAQTVAPYTVPEDAGEDPDDPEDGDTDEDDDDQDADTAGAAPIEQCGNGELEAGEECDDGNLVGTDDCSNECLIVTNDTDDNEQTVDDNQSAQGGGCSLNANPVKRPAMTLLCVFVGLCLLSYWLVRSKRARH